MAAAPTSPERTVLELVGVLHAEGVESLRIAPAMAPSGLYWRCALAPASLFSPHHGARIRFDVDVDYPLVVRYSSADGTELFGISCEGTSPAEVATAFAERYPELLAASRASDPAYVAWYAAMLAETARGALPYAMSDWGDPDDVLPTVGAGGVTLALPPLPLA